MNGTSSEVPVKPVLEKQMSLVRQSSMRNGLERQGSIRNGLERQGSIRNGLEKQASIGSNSSRCWSPDPADRGEYRKLQNDMQMMTLKVKALEEKVDKVVREAGLNLDQGPGGRGAAFTARLKEDTAVRSLDTIIFDDVLTNIGNGYNPETGTFKAPYTGRYLFSLTICAQNQKQVWAEIVSGPLVIGQLSAGDIEIEFASASVSVVAFLEAGDEVHVRETKMWTGYFHGEGFTVFTGLLLQ